MKIGLIPLDERPANTRYPAMTAAIAGAELLLPPPAALSDRRRPGDPAALADWMDAVAPDLDALIVSCEMLGYGGLIASRTGHEPAAAVLARLERLRALRRARPGLPIYGFNVVTRVSNANDAVEEPDYWAEHGERLYALSQLLDRRRQGQPVGAEIARLEAALPAAARRDFLARRLRNHTVNAAVLGLLVDGAFDLLVLSSDDTSPFGLPSAEKAWLAGWAELLAFDPAALLMYPGADEVGCALVARLLNRRAGAAPTVAAAYAPPAAADNVAAYEDGPIRLTVERQALACGAEPAGKGAEAAIWLAVNAPLPRRSEWAPEHAAVERDERLPALRALLAEARGRQRAGQAVAVADVAYPNGADPALVELMLGELELPGLAAYGAWNTAGNSVGAALAQACAARLIDGPAGRAAHERLLLHRLLEDYGYQQIARAELRAWLQAIHRTPELRPDLAPAAAARVEARLAELLERLPGFAGRYRIAPGSLRFPWGRTFEVDFELAQQ